MQDTSGPIYHHRGGLASGIPRGGLGAGSVELRDDGVSQEFIRRVFTPVGLPLATETPAEIALAVAGEIVAAWRGRGDWARQQKDAYYERTRRHESGTR